MLVHSVVPIEAAEPEFGDVLNILLDEHVDAVRRPEQTVPDHHLLELLERLLTVIVSIEGPLEHMCCYFHKAGEFLERVLLALCKLCIEDVEVQQKLLEVRVDRRILAEHHREGILQN